MIRVLSVLCTASNDIPLRLAKCVSSDIPAHRGGELGSLQSKDLNNCLPMEKLSNTSGNKKESVFQSPMV